MKTIREDKAGKATIRLLEQSGKYIGIVLQNDQIRSRIDGPDADALWQQLRQEVARTAPEFFGFDGARTRFRRIFKNGFAGAEFQNSERAYKLKAKQKLEDLLPLETARTSEGNGEKALAVFRATNLLSPFEQTRIQAAMRGPTADAFIRGAAAFTDGDIEAGIRQMEAALRPDDVAKWTAMTYLPFLWRPDRHMFLKPEVTRKFAERVGHSYHIAYSASLDPEVYRSLLDMTEKTEQQLSDLNPADRIDIQSFIWVVGAYTLEDEENITNPKTPPDQ